jgi:hypothetical protein
MDPKIYVKQKKPDTKEQYEIRSSLWRQNKAKKKQMEK